MKFISRVTFKGNNLIKQQVEIPAGTYVETEDDLICFDGLPVCGIDSQVAHDYFIWADDGKEAARSIYENTILFEDRIRSWEEKIPIYDEKGKIIDYKEIMRVGRYTPEESKFIQDNFTQFLKTKDTILFNNYFYRQSDIEEVRVLANYLNR